jgi:nucleotide-binding universal stress UspA family protein
MTGDIIDQMMAGAKALVDGLLSQLSIPPGLTVQTVIEPSPPVALLRRLAESADLIVLGRHHQSLFERMTEGSITSPLSAHAPCPVMVVPAEYMLGAGTQKPVVVALDATTAAGSALEFAFDEAAQRQVDLIVLHARPLDELPITAEEYVVTLAEILAGWKADRPEINVRTVVLSGEADEVIVDASADAGLLIVGRPHEQHLGGWARSVARGVLRRARCPLAIVPPSPLPSGHGRHPARATVDGT